LLKRLFGRDDEAVEPAAAEQIETGLAPTRRSFRDRFAGVFGPVDITPETWEELEDRLIQSDVGAATATALVSELREAGRHVGVRRADELPALLQTVMVRALTAATAAASPAPSAGDGRQVALVVGVNGSGKTTSIAKLARWYAARGETVLLVAADTFRAAAIDQLQIWGERLAVPVAAGQPGGDPAAVVFDALGSTVGRQADHVIIDTAGRLHTQTNLMAELEKVRRVIQRSDEAAPQETLLVLDATTGQNGLAQAKAFTTSVQVTGVILAKLDSSAKGGVAFAIVRELGLPIRFVGTGEGADDLAAFDAAAYAAGVLGLPSPRAVRA
jgi:fused signal recognition particle receptor